MYPSSFFIPVVYERQDIDVRIHDAKVVLHCGNKGNYFWPRFKTTPLLVNNLEIPAQSDPVVTIGTFERSHQIFGVEEKCVYLHADKMDMESIDTSNMCSHLQRKLFEKEGVYHHLWTAALDDPALTAVVRSRQLHIYRNGKKVLVLAGKAAPKVIREDKICAFLPKV